MDRGGFSHNIGLAFKRSASAALDLGLQATVSWWGKRGLNLRACSHFLRNTAHQQPAAPFLLLVHAGSNAVGMVSKKHDMELILHLINTAGTRGVDRSSKVGGGMVSNL